VSSNGEGWAEAPNAAVMLALYSGLYAEQGLAQVAAETVARAWGRPIAVVLGGLMNAEGSWAEVRLFACYDLTEDADGRLRAAAVFVAQP
jgi:hypothetical protein